MTIVMATHEMGFARRVADQVCFLADGVVAESGPPEQVLGAPEQPASEAVPVPGYVALTAGD